MVAEVSAAWESPPGADATSDPPGADATSDPPGADATSDPPGADATSDPPGADATGLASAGAGVRPLDSSGGRNSPVSRARATSTAETSWVLLVGQPGPSS